MINTEHLPLLITRTETLLFCYCIITVLIAPHYLPPPYYHHYFSRTLGLLAHCRTSATIDLPFVLTVPAGLPGAWLRTILLPTPFYLEVPPTVFVIPVHAFCLLEFTYPIYLPKFLLPPVQFGCCRFHHMGSLPPFLPCAVRAPATVNVCAPFSFCLILPGFFHLPVQCLPVGCVLPYTCSYCDCADLAAHHTAPPHHALWLVRATCLFFLPVFFLIYTLPAAAVFACCLHLRTFWLNSSPVT